MILNENDYQAFVASIDLLSLHCPVCGVVGLFILYGHYKRCAITDDVSNDCKINIRVQRIQCTQCKFTHSLLPSNFIPYTIIPIGVKAAEVTVISKSVFEHAKASNVAKAYEKLTQETVHSEKVKRTGTQER